MRPVFLFNQYLTEDLMFNSKSHEPGRRTRFSGQLDRSAEPRGGRYGATAGTRAAHASADEYSDDAAAAQYRLRLPGAIPVEQPGHAAYDGRHGASSRSMSFELCARAPVSLRGSPERALLWRGAEAAERLE
jgi:hypothetical protein